MFDISKLLVLLVFLGSSGVCFAGRRKIRSMDELRQSLVRHPTWIDQSSLLQNRGVQPRQGPREMKKLSFAPHTMDVQPPFYNDIGYKNNRNGISGYMGEIPEYYDDLGYEQPKVENIYGALNKMPPIYNDLGQQGNVAAGFSHRDVPVPVMQPYYDDLRNQHSGYDPSATKLVDIPPFSGKQEYEPTKYNSLRDTDDISAFYDDLGYKAKNNFKRMFPSYASMEDEETIKETEVDPAAKRNKGSEDGRKIRSVDLGSFWFWAFVVLCVVTFCGLGGTGVYVIVIGLCDICYSILCTVLFLFLFISIFTILNTSVVIMET